uniref:Uncharacterized protein n=1 Tax=Arundo donax TaxID=35708 RepID=A0A0A8Y3V2_ARUDO
MILSSHTYFCLTLCDSPLLQIHDKFMSVISLLPPFSSFHVLTEFIMRFLSILNDVKAVHGCMRHKMHHIVLIQLKGVCLCLHRLTFWSIC